MRDAQGSTSHERRFLKGKKACTLELDAVEGIRGSQKGPRSGTRKLGRAT